MTNIKVVLHPKKNIEVVLKPKQGIKIDSSNKYLYDPTLIQKYVNASREYSEEAKLSEANAKASEMNAELSAEQAKASETKATQEATASAESAYQSQQSALASHEYASNAEADAQNVNESLDKVLESLDKVLISEANAKASEGIALDSADVAKTKSQEALQSANTATEKADEASQFALECQAIKDSLGSVYVFKGSVNTESELPNNAKVGDVYDVKDTGINYAWTGTEWDSLGVTVDFDLSNYATKEYVDATEQEIIENYMDADSELQTQINGQATAIAHNTSDIVDIKNKLDNETGGGSGRNVGDIFYTTRQDTELNGAVECNGATYNIGDFEGAESIGNLLLTGKIISVPFFQYEMSIEDRGFCEYFAFDGNDTFKVPTLPCVILSGNQSPVVGNGMALGLTDGSMLGGFATGTAVTGATGNQTVYGRPVGTTPSSTAAAAKFANNKSIGVTTDPTRSGLVANLDTIAVEYRAMVQLANSTTDEAVITVTATLQELQDINEQIDTKIDIKIADKQDKLISGTNIKTINGESVVGSGDILIDGMQNKITNCITEIPQDIKLELNDDNLILKAGSKVYVPNGVGVFDEVIITEDKIATAGWGNTGIMVIYLESNSKNLYMAEKGRDSSGTTSPTQTDTRIWYDTTNNEIKRYSAAVDSGVRLSLPLAICTKTTTGDAKISSIDQVFNGFGYIGSTVFTLPNVKGLIPDGRNEDGTLKNIEFTTTGVLITTNPANVRTNLAIGISSDSIERFAIYKYDETKNLNYDGERSGYFNKVLIATYDRNATGAITNFRPKNTFRAVDANETIYVVETYKNGYSWYRVYSDGWCEQGGINSNNSTSARTQVLLKPFQDTNYVVQVTYNNDDNVSNGAITVYSKTTNQFSMKSWSSDSLCWEAKGYIA